MRINHNIAALNTYRQLNSASGAQSKSMEKLSSGLRINRAGDDAAGLAISEKMRAQVRGLDRASANAQDGISMIQTAEGALNETHDILQRMRELATQAANDTNIGSDRQEIQKEMNQLTSEINRIGNTTEFNTQKVLKGSSAATYGGGSVGNKSGDASALTIGLGTFTGNNVNGVAVDTSGLTVTPGGTSYSSTETKVSAINGFTGNLASSTITWTDAGASDGAIQAGEVSLSAGGGWTASAVNVVNGTDTEITFTNGAQSFKYTAATSSFNSGTPTAAFTINGTPGASTYSGSIVVGSGADATTFTVGSNGAATASTGTYSGLTVSAAGATTGNGTGSIDITGQTASSTVGSQFTATLQIGANEGQSFSMSITDMRAQSLGIAGTTAGNTAAGAANAAFTATTDASGNSNALTDVSTSGTAEYALDVTNNSKASAAITVIDKAIEKVSAERSKLGAYQNRLDHTINNLGTSSENLTAAESRIRDVDYALAA